LQINDPVAKHRAEAFQALSNLVIDDPETKQVLCKRENIKKVLEHICDIELDVRVAAVGTLRYLFIK
jgi:DNA-binding transcriptional regulator LsrR (DeoR family)